MFVISNGDLNGVTRAFFVERVEELKEAITFFIQETGCDPEEVCVNRVGERVG